MGSALLKVLALPLQTTALLALRAGERFCGATRHHVAGCLWTAGIAVATHQILFADRGPSTHDWSMMFVCGLWTWNLWVNGSRPEAALVTGDRSRFGFLAAIDALVGVIFLLQVAVASAKVAAGQAPGPMVVFMVAVAVLDVPRDQGGGHPFVQRTWAKLRRLLPQPLLEAAEPGAF